MDTPWGLVPMRFATLLAWPAVCPSLIRSGSTSRAKLKVKVVVAVEMFEVWPECCRLV